MRRHPHVSLHIQPATNPIFYSINYRQRYHIHSADPSPGPVIGHFKLLEQLCEDIEVLPDKRSHILWVGDRHKATKFVYFFHGGGYITPAISGLFEWVLQAYVLGSPRAGDRVAVAFLQYTLAPSARFPTQMCQAVSGLQFLLNKGINPSQLVVGGDSAGGNITM